MEAFFSLLGQSGTLIRNAETLLEIRRLKTLKNIVFVLFMLSFWSKFYSQVFIVGPVRSVKDLINSLSKIVFKQLRRIPLVKAKIQVELDKSLREIENSIAKREGNITQTLVLPRHGLQEEVIMDNLRSFQNLKAADWQSGKVSGTIYHGGEELTRLLSQAYHMFASSNPLHPEVFPGVRRMEAESVAMVLDMYNAPKTGCGVMTSGGSESIIMACKAYREMYKDKKGIQHPEMIVPETIHAAFMKAAGYFNIKLISIPVDPVTCKVRVDRVARAINRNTIMIAGSAVSFPHGIADDIAALGKLAKKCNIGFHVDCCLGSFIMPFLEKAGFPTTPFDFRVDGVTSISCDTHKYGFAPKGSSVVMYQNEVIRKYQYFLCADWTGGIYASPSMTGSRPGALIAGCWAALMNIGEDGYLDSCKKIVGARKTIEEGIRSTPELHVLGEPIGPVIAFGANAPLNVYDVGDKMSARGWNISSLQKPAALHISITLPWTQSGSLFVKDLKEVVAGLVNDPKSGNGSTAAIYGTAASVPDKTIIEDVAAGFIDLLYKAEVKRT
ncbi:sphingosine-1-phosphate lyase [Spinellus fusiger]|nr:sphingosine-1-phosphate lyase [Spinellus fusiger]